MLYNKYNYDSVILLVCDKTDNYSGITLRNIKSKVLLPWENIIRTCYSYKKH